MLSKHMVFRYFTPYQGFWLEILTFQCESKNLTTLIAQEKILRALCHCVKKYIVLWSFLNQSISVHLFNHQFYNATCTCKHHLVVILMNFTGVRMLLLGNFLPCAHVCTIWWSFLCHVCEFTPLCGLKNSAKKGGATHVSLDLALVTCLGIFDVLAHE